MKMNKENEFFPKDFEFEKLVKKSKETFNCKNGAHFICYQSHRFIWTLFYWEYNDENKNGKGNRLGFDLERYYGRQH